MEAFYAVLPVFLLIAVGAAVHMTDVLPENTGAAMGLYVLKLALPVLMLHILAGASRLDLAHGGFWLGVIGAQMLCYLLGYVVDRLFSRRGTGPAIISGLACSASNTAFVGLPIVASLLPGNHEAMVVAGLAAQGETSISEIDHIDRGYEKIEKAYAQLGACIRREE
jgi:malonate transporter